MRAAKPSLEIGDTGGLRATFLPALGMVCSSLTFAGRQLLELRGGPEAYAARGSTFGIPLLAPWANRLAAWEYEAAGVRVSLDRSSPYVRVDGATGLPIHGLLAASPLWAVVESGDGGLHAALEFASDPALLAAFPFPHRLDLRASVAGARLSIRVTVTPTGELPVPISFGFHPYLRLPGCDRRSWTIALPVEQRMVLDDRGIPTGATERIAVGALNGTLGERTFDDAFDRVARGADGSPPEFALAGDRLRIAVEFVSGFPVAQVYAPADSQFICFEPMTAPVDALRSGRELRLARPGESFSAEFAVTVTEN